MPEAEYVEIPLHLCQVLEEEFENLPPPPGADAPPAFDGSWTFGPGDVRDDVAPGGLELIREQLMSAHDAWVANHAGPEPTDEELAQADFYTFLAFKCPELWRPESPPVDLAGALNEMLRDRRADGLRAFEPARFERLAGAMRKETRALFELWRDGEEWSDDGGPGGFDASDLARFRRLLVEDAFGPWALRRAYDVRLSRAVEAAHVAERSAICLSGGGIRSGTFALGVLQSLARRRLLEKFDYLSTVSGGGYIGGWLSAWVHRHPGGLEGVVEALDGAKRAPKLATEPEPLRHLREYSSFITPKTGALSADAWTFVVIYVRNLLLNWVVLLPLLASVLMIPRVSDAVVLAQPGLRVLGGLLLLSGVGVYLLKPDRKTAATLLVVGAVSAAALAVGYAGGRSSRAERVVYVEGLLLVAGTLLGAYSLAYMRLNRPSNAGAVRPGGFWATHRDQSSFLWLCLLPLAASASLLTTFWAWFRRTAGLSSEKVVTGVGFGWRPPRAAVLTHTLYGRELFQVGTRTTLLGREVFDVGPHVRLFGWEVFDMGRVGLFGWELMEFGPRLKVLGWEVGEFGGFLLYGLALGLVGWVLYVLLAGLPWLSGGYDEVVRMARSTPRKLFAGVVKNAGRELVVTVLASVIGAVLLYVAAVKIPVFYDPVHPASATAICWGLTTEAVPPYERWYASELYTWLAVPSYLLVFFLGITLFVGFTSRRSEKSPRGGRAGGAWGWVKARAPELLLRPFDVAYVEDEDREWMARASAWLFIVAGGWLFLGGLVLFGPLLSAALGKWLVGIGGLSGLVSWLGGRSALTPGNKKDEAQAGWLKTLGVNVVVLAAFVFFACIILAVSALTGTLIAWLAQYLPDFLFGVGSGGVTSNGPWGWVEALAVRLRPLRDYFVMPPFQLSAFAGRYPFQGAESAFRVAHFPSWLYLLALALALQLAGRGFARVINLNKFSLHAGYRDRLVRAFLGASRPAGDRQANPFTGFDPRDDLHMQELRPGLLREADFKALNALTHFVANLNRPGSRPDLPAGASGVATPAASPDPHAGLLPPPDPTAEATRRKQAAKYLHDRIVGIEGESRRYLKDPPESIEHNPSFRSALFADLGHILQDDDFREVPAFSAYVDYADARCGARRPARGSERIMHNRILLSQVFPYIEYPPRPSRLLHVVNMALNLVGGDKLAWQQRRAESFTATVLHAGSLFVGYRRTREYGGRNGIRLGTAVAVSGAAASSNMGYFSPSVFVTFVLTFFNARLGWWLGNPGVRGSTTFFRSHPQNALSPVIDEAFGLTDDENPYVLLSDGGHFENLGLYEMVLRRCRYVVVVDGSADPSGAYDDLAGAVRKIRIDFGIRIDFPSPFPILARPASEDAKKARAADYYVVGDIHYEDVDTLPASPAGDRAGEGGRHPLTGTLIYVKPAVYDREPRDVFNYAKGDETFPHESTADQFFDEPQFESHRVLGFHVLESMLGAPRDVTLSPPWPAEFGTVAELAGWLRRKAELRGGGGGGGGDD